jgi:hypothetical protein
MAMQQVEYEFPDSDSKTTEVEVNLDEKEDNGLEIEGAVGREDMKVPAKEPKSEELEIEIEDDTPVADRGRKPSNPPEEVTDEELENYSDKVKGRIKHLSKGYHDERRAKETALREREELEKYARNLISQNDKLKGTVDTNHNTLIQSAKKQVEGEMAMAKGRYKVAYESGETDAILEAQTQLNSAQIRMDKVNGLKPKKIQALQPQTTPVQPQVEAPPANVQRDEKAENWRDENASWFGEDDEMTALAYGLHHKLTKEGVDPTSDTYYEKINARMRQVFPDQFDEEPESTKRKSSNVVAPATRSTSPKKVTLNQSQVAIAKRLGISLEDYAKQAAELMRNK